jgi:hypothetical protein
VFTEPIRGLFHGVAAFSKQPFEGPADVLVEQNPDPPSLHGLFGLQRGLPNSLERRLVRAIEFAQFLDMSIVVRERLIHVCEGDIELICDVSWGLSAIDHPRGDVANPDARAIDPWLTTEYVIVTGDTHT